MEGGLPALPGTKKQDFGEILELYKQAIDGAHNTGFLQYEAAGILLHYNFDMHIKHNKLNFFSFFSTGLELLGRFWLSSKALHQKRVALVYLREAVSVYEKWDAIAKAKALHTECLSIDSFDKLVFLLAE